jgi:hypothetical protein
MDMASGVLPHPVLEMDAASARLRRDPSRASALLRCFYAADAFG